MGQLFAALDLHIVQHPASQPEDVDINMGFAQDWASAIEGILAGELKRNDDIARHYMNEANSRYPSIPPQVCIVPRSSESSKLLVLVAYPTRKQRRQPRAGKRKYSNQLPVSQPHQGPGQGAQPVCEGANSDGDFGFDDFSYALGYEDNEEYECEDCEETSEDQLEDDERGDDMEVDTQGDAEGKQSADMVRAVMAAMQEEERLAMQRPSITIECPEFEALNAIFSMAGLYLGFCAAADGIVCTIRLTPRGRAPSGAPPPEGKVPTAQLERRDMFLDKRRRVHAPGNPT